MRLGKPFIERRRKQKPRCTVKLPEIAHQAHPASESIAPSYPVRHMIRQVRQAARPDSQNARCSLRRTAPNRAHMAYDHGGLKALRRKPSGGRKREK